jgi:membrane protein
MPEKMISARGRSRDLPAKYYKRNGPLLAKGLAFSLVLGTMPIFFITLTISAYIYKVSPGLQELVTGQLLDVLPANLSTLLLTQIHRLASRAGSLGLITIAIFIVTSIALFDSLEGSMSAMLSSKRRKFHHARLISLSLMSGVVIVYYLTVALSATARYFKDFLSLSPQLFYWGSKFTSGLFFAFILLVLYYLFSRRRLRFFPTLTIACISSFFWQLIGAAGSRLIQYAGGQLLVYGAITWIIIFLTYMRLLAELIIISSLLVGEFSPA